MKELTYFYLAGCPFCYSADRMLKELSEENPEFAKISIKKIEERENSALADQYDYYYVPCLWMGNRKLHEGAASKEKLRAVLEKAINS
ncbi:MAG TPA: thioredoxin family protein [Oscillospiraceae bacterium]|nr:thioredoxin family protein [Oscillospiraceae bacterium]HPF56655.1 thioredoxin family protein [Clostridiales bacterium]HPK36578.1 thioredoxin family protein [Oscillospiraceae bacterium]HPR76773.1 thioredoxin family protein [Oscillospiraceae bacterium]